MNSLTKNIKKHIIPISGSFLWAMFPALFLYLTNAEEVNLSDIVSPLAISLLIALGIYGVGFIITKCAVKAGITSFLLSSIILNFVIVEKVFKLVFKNMWYWNTIPFIIVIAVHILYFVFKKINKDVLEIVSLVTLIAASGMIIVNMVTAVPHIVNKVSISSQNVEKDNNIVNQNTEDMPNIYMLVWDEYASFNQIQKHYDYDNAVLSEFLEENNFTNSYYSFNEYPSTSMVMTNAVNLDYVVDIHTAESIRTEMRANGKLFDIMQQYGYETRKYTSNGFYGDDYLQTNDSSATTSSGETAQDLFWKKTAIYPFLSNNLSERAFKEVEIVKNLSMKENLTENNTFTLMHVIFPHKPFYFDEFGNAAPVSDALNWKDKSVYLGQYKYATKLMIDQIKAILEHDPEALILLMSDHGARSSSDTTFAKNFTLEDKTNILNAFYYKGDDLSHIADKSTVNTLRLLLNEVFGTDFEEVEVPSY